MKIYTKGGDKGSTSLIGGTRVSKSSIRVKAYGAVDTANATLGVAKSHVNDENVKNLVEICQRNLFKIGAKIAKPKEEELDFGDIELKDIEFLEEIIDEMTSQLPPLNNFILPGNTIESSYFHKARVDIRTAEREVVSLDQREEVDENILKYLNRLSDLAFTLARYVDRNTSQRKNNLEEKLLKVLDLALEKSISIDVPVSIAIVDESGNLKNFYRRDKAILASLDLSIKKAKTAFSLNMTTEAFREMTKASGDLYGLENSQDLIALAGGIPLYDEGRLIGAIGVSGGSTEEDVEIASYGASYFNEKR